MSIKNFPNHFFTFVNKTQNGCWEWIGRLSPSGYGLFTLCGYVIHSHRISYEFHKSKIPKKAVIDHLCRNRKCINPDHLEAVTQKENIHRGLGVAAQNILKTHCVRGHEYTKENTTILKHGYRECKKCRKIHTVNRYQRHKSNLKKKAKSYYQLNKEKMSEKNRKRAHIYYQSNKEKMRKKQRVYYLNNIIQCRIANNRRSKKYRENKKIRISHQKPQRKG